MNHELWLILVQEKKMFLSQHAVVGAAIAIKTGNPWLGLVEGIASHHILDALPHFDGIEKTEYDERGREILTKTDWIKSFGDVGITSVIIIVVALKTQQWFLVFLGAMGGSISDILDHIPWWNYYFRQTKFGRLFHLFHDRFHFHWVTIKWYNITLAIIFQLMITIGGIWVCLAR